MDLLPALVAQAPSLGVGGTLLLLVLYLLRAQATERAEYRTALAAEEAAHAAELGAERTRVLELNNLLDAERGRRRAAEDAAHVRQDTTTVRPFPQQPWSDPRSR